MQPSAQRTSMNTRHDYGVVMAADAVIGSFEVRGFPSETLITPEGR